MRSIEDSFFEKVDKSGPCWLWTASCWSGGYGRFRTHSAHRFSWELHYGEIPEGMCVLHKCDVRNCVRPCHLFLGTYKDNADDRDAKGRNIAHGGAKNGRSKLTPEMVEEMKRLKDEGMPLKELGPKFGVTRGHAGKIVRGASWAGESN